MGLNPSHDGLVGKREQSRSIVEVCSDDTTRGIMVLILRFDGVVERIGATIGLLES